MGIRVVCYIEEDPKYIQEVSDSIQEVIDETWPQSYIESIESTESE